MTQIAVGKITKSQICKQTGKVLFVIQFSYNLRYVSKKGGKVEDDDNNLQKKNNAFF